MKRVDLTEKLEIHLRTDWWFFSDFGDGGHSWPDEIDEATVRRGGEAFRSLENRRGDVERGPDARDHNAADRSFDLSVL